MLSRMSNAKRQTAYLSLLGLRWKTTAAQHQALSTCTPSLTPLTCCLLNYRDEQFIASINYFSDLWHDFIECISGMLDELRPAIQRCP